MALTNRKSIIYPPLADGRRYIISRHQGHPDDYHFHVYMMLLIQPDDLKHTLLKQNKELILSRQNLATIMEWEKKSVADLEHDFNGLRERLLERKLHLISEAETRCMNFFCEISIASNTIKFVLNYQLIDFLWWQQHYWGKDNLKQVNFAATHNFKSVYSEMIYNQLINCLPPQKISFEIGELKKMLWATAESYNDIHKFKLKVLDPIVKDINQFTQFKLSYTLIKHGAKYTHVELVAK